MDQKGQEQRDGQTQREEALRKPTLGLRAGPVAQEFEARSRRRKRKNRQPSEQEYPWVPQCFFSLVIDRNKLTKKGKAEAIKALEEATAQLKG